MRKIIDILNDILFLLLIPFIGIAYLLESIYMSIKKWNHHRKLKKGGRATIHNPYADQWN